MAKEIPGNFGVRTRTFVLVPVRVFLGVLLVLFVIDQLKKGWLGADGMRLVWQPFIDNMHWGALKGLLTKHVLNKDATGGIFMSLEALVGILLIVGLGVRLASAIGMGLSGLQLLVFGYGYTGALAAVRPVGALDEPMMRAALELHLPQLGLYALMFLLLLACLLTGAGKSFGLDGMIGRGRARRLAKAAEAAPSAEEPLRL